MMLYTFGTNWNPITRQDEQYLTTIKIPAQSDEEASQKLVALIGKTAARKCWLNDKHEY